MDENNKYCACTGTDAMFHIKLNQQGPEGKQGPQGIKGTDGISPSITVEDSTDDNYQLRVTTAYNTFVTPNLKGDAKVLIDPWTLKGDPPTFTKIVSASGNIEAGIKQVVKAYLPNNGNISVNWNDSRALEVYHNGVLTSKSVVNLLNTNSIIANDPIMLTHNQDGTLTLDFDDTNYQHKLTTAQLAAANSGITSDKVAEFANKQDKFATVIDNENATSLDTNGKALSITASTIAVGNNLVNEINGSNSQLYLKQNDVVGSDNITVTKTATGIIIAGTVSPYTLPVATTTTLGGIKVGKNLTIDEDGTLNATGGDVTAAGNNTFTGTNTFKGNVIFNQDLSSSANSNTVGITSNVSMQIGSPTNPNQQTIYVARRTSTKGSTYVKIAPANNGRATFSVLRSSTIDASTTSSVEFSYDEDGVYYKTANSNEINLIELITIMSNTISSLTGRITALEAEINGGNA